jgi:hypothetical protein
MDHWSARDEPVAADAAMPEPAAAPPRQTPVERITEILEALFNLERDLTGELLAELAQCSLEDLAKLFGCTVPAPAPPDFAVADEYPPLPKEQLTEAERVRLNFEHSRWDENGRRIWPERNKSAFAFTKHSDRPSTRARGATHWSW